MANIPVIMTSSSEKRAAGSAPSKEPPGKRRQRDDAPGEDRMAQLIHAGHDHLKQKDGEKALKFFKKVGFRSFSPVWLPIPIPAHNMFTGSGPLCLHEGKTADVP